MLIYKNKDFKLSADLLSLRALLLLLQNKLLSNKSKWS